MQEIQSLVEQYAKFWAIREDFQAQNICELGLWDGGSLVFWFECFHPEKHVGIDILQRTDGMYFKQYLHSRGVQEKIRTYWGVDQTDAQTLRDIVAHEFSAPLDLVIDDASHLYTATKTSFEILFPLLRPEGLYIIEDWAWFHWAEFQIPNHPWAQERPLTDLIFELVEAAGSSPDLINSVAVFQGFTAIERGQAVIPEPEGFSLNRFIARRPQCRTASDFQKGKHFLKRMLKL